MQSVSCKRATATASFAEVSSAVALASCICGRGYGGDGARWVVGRGLTERYCQEVLRRGAALTENDPESLSLCIPLGLVRFHKRRWWWSLAPEDPRRPLSRRKGKTCRWPTLLSVPLPVPGAGIHWLPPATLQERVYCILPPASAMTGYAIGIWKPSANGPFSLVLKWHGGMFFNHTDISNPGRVFSYNCSQCLRQHILKRNRSNRDGTTSFLFVSFFARCHYVRTLRVCFDAMLLLQNIPQFLRKGADNVRLTDRGDFDGQKRGDVKYLFSGQNQLQHSLEEGCRK